MKRSKGEVYGKARDALDVRFEAQHLTSFSGLIIFQRLFAKARTERAAVAVLSPPQGQRDLRSPRGGDDADSASAAWIPRASRCALLP